MKHLSLKVWFVTSLAVLVGSTALWAASRLLTLFFGSCRDGVLWLIGNSGCVKRAIITLCLTIFIVTLMYYAVRIARAITLWTEAKASKERQVSL